MRSVWHSIQRTPFSPDMRSVLSAALRPAHALAALSAPMAAAPAAASAATGCAARLAFTRGFHASAAALAAPAAAVAKPAAGGKGAASGPPAPGSARYVREGWGQATLVPPVQPATKTAEEAAADAAELEASRVLPELHAEVRERTGSKYSAELRGQHLRIPGIVQDRSNPRGNQLLISMDRFELEKLCRKYRRSVRHRVCLLHIKGQPEPIKVIPDEFPRHAVTQDLLACNWFLFKPRREKVRVTMPIVFTGADECIGVKRGGVLVILRDAVPCVWTGDENVPPFIHIDLTNADGGKVFRNDDLNLPVGLRLHSPQTDYVLATVLGHAKSREEDEPSAEAGAGAAATPQQPSAIQLEKDKKAKERREEEEMVAQKLAQKARK